jgi:HEAT repeat protein
MNVGVDPAGTIGLIVAALFGAGLILHLFRRWRYWEALSRARGLAARLRSPATTLGDIEDQSSAVDDLAEFRDVAATVQATRELLDAKDATIRSAAIEVLRRTRALDVWARDLRRGSYRTKLRAIEALGEVGDERAVEELIEALGDDDSDVARAASHAVIARDPDYASDRLADALASPNRRLAETAAATLVRMGDDAVEALVSQLGSSSAQARRLAAESLGAIGGARLAGALVMLLDTDPDPVVRVAVAEAVTRLGSTSVLEDLRRVARFDPDWFVRARAYSLLAEVEAPGAADFLLQALAEIEPETVNCEGEGEDVEVVLQGSQRIQAAIIAGLRLLGLSDEEIAGARRRAAEAQLDSEQVAAEVADPDWSETVGALRERDPVRRADAVRALAEAGRGAAAALKRALSDPEPLVRTEACRALGRMGANDCLSALAERLEDPDGSVRLEASFAMRAIVSRDAAQELRD